MQIFDVLWGDLIECTVAEIRIVFGSHAPLAIVGRNERRDFDLGQVLRLRALPPMGTEQRQERQTAGMTEETASKGPRSQEENVPYRFLSQEATSVSCTSARDLTLEQQELSCSSCEGKFRAMRC